MEPARRVGDLFVGKYRLERLLGVGGMGAVYEAVHVGVEKHFAVKILKSDGARAPDSAQRFTQEARAAARIGHPNLVEVFDLGEAEDGTLYMVMELLKGRSLAEALRDGPLPVAMAREIASGMLGALEAAHRAGFIHRDIKPGNIFLAERPGGGTAVKVLDFGIAKLVKADTPSLTQSGVAVGTPLYMSPEQVLAEREVDGRADVWAVGATLFEMLTGRPVHLAPTATAAAVKVVTETAPRVRSFRPEVDPGLDAVVARALAVDRAARYATARDMQLALDECGASLAPTLAADSGLAPSVKTVVEDAVRAKKRRSRLVVLGGGSLVLGVLVTGAFFARRNGPRMPATVPTTSGEARALATSPGPASSEPAPSASSTSALSSGGSVDASASARPGPVAEAGAPAVSLGGHPQGHPPTHLPRPPSLTCDPGEHASAGHCCAVGLEWQMDHCDRPLAKEVPF
jgi:serine/threonine protein kinase